MRIIKGTKALYLLKKKWSGLCILCPGESGRALRLKSPGLLRLVRIQYSPIVLVYDAHSPFGRPDIRKATTNSFPFALFLAAACYR